MCLLTTNQIFLWKMQQKCKNGKLGKKSLARVNFGKDLLRTYTEMWYLFSFLEKPVASADFLGYFLEEKFCSQLPDTCPPLFFHKSRLKGGKLSLIPMRFSAEFFSEENWFYQTAFNKLVCDKNRLRINSKSYSIDRKLTRISLKLTKNQVKLKQIKQFSLNWFWSIKFVKNQFQLISKTKMVLLLTKINSFQKKINFHWFAPMDKTLQTEIN